MQVLLKETGVEQKGELGYAWVTEVTHEIIIPSGVSNGLCEHYVFFGEHEQ